MQYRGAVHPEPRIVLSFGSNRKTTIRHPSPFMAH